MTLTRFSDWEFRLAEYLRSIRDKPFVWGRHDCALLIADSALAMTATDMASDFRGTYKTVKGAFVQIKRMTGKPTLESLCDYKADQYGLQEVRPLQAGRGDAVLYRPEPEAEHHGPMLGLCTGSQGLFFNTDHQPVVLPLDRVFRAWII